MMLMGTTKRTNLLQMTAIKQLVLSVKRQRMKENEKREGKEMIALANLIKSVCVSLVLNFELILV